MSSSVTAISKELRALASAETATNLQRFFKTGPGQYGEGDIFLGIKVPPLRALAKQHGDADLDTIVALLNSRYHEERFFALLLLMQLYQRAEDSRAGQLLTISIWATRTASTTGTWSTSPHRASWDAICRTVRARSCTSWRARLCCGNGASPSSPPPGSSAWTTFDDTLKIAGILLQDEHDLMHKAVGWMLREVGKRDLAVEEDFLKQHYRDMPRTMLRYAIERFPEPKRKAYLYGKV